MAPQPGARLKFATPPDRIEETPRPLHLLTPADVFLAEPQPTAYDLHFRALNVPVRVSPLFFLLVVVLGFDGMTGAAEDLRQNVGLLVAIWTAICFGSILIHELGHSMAMRRFGMDSKIVLYHFGGLAIPTGASFSSFERPRIGPKQQIVISAAGPAVQLILAAGVILVLIVGGYGLVVVPAEEAADYVPKLTYTFLDRFLPQPPSDAHVIAGVPALAIVSLLWVNVFWALLNLAPVYPLDGGQISRDVFLLSNVKDGIRNSLILSIAAGVVIAVWGLTNGLQYLGVMFGLLAFSSFQLLQAYNGYGGGFGGGRPW